MFSPGWRGQGTHDILIAYTILIFIIRQTEETGLFSYYDNLNMHDKKKKMFRRFR